MALTRFKAKNHPQQSRRWGQDDSTDDRATHPLVFAELDEQYGPFTLDVAAAPHNTKCVRYYTRETDGLAQTWGGSRVWCNPPYSDIAPWVRKAWAEASGVDGLIAMLLPANRTEQTWWQQMVEPYRDQPGSPLTTRFLAGRMRFLAPGQTAVGPNQRPPFGVVLLTLVCGEWPLAYDGSPSGGLLDLIEDGD